VTAEAKETNDAMFRRKREDENEMKPETTADDTAASDALSAAKPSPRPMAPTPPVPPAGAAFAKPTAPIIGRGGVSWAQPAATAPRAGSSDAPSESKKLIVGRDIVLSGQITSCERLIVEGRVEASLSDSRLVEIAETGHFKGTAEIETADIAGRFEGTLLVRERLFIRSTGKVSGKITYGQIEIEPGGEISGEVHVGPRRPAAAEAEPAYGTSSGS
jgi:cytoskeletal protein CcmA (bactofilin family)